MTLSDPIRRAGLPTATRRSICTAVDARYVREKPSGIGTYVRALIDRIPSEGSSDRFIFWAHRLAARPLSTATNTRDVTVRPGPNSPLPIYWPAHYASFREVDVFHSPHNMMPRRLPCRSVVTIHDVMAIERPDLHLQGIERVAKSGYYQRAVWRALHEATRLIAPTEATADRICALAPGAASRLTVISEAAENRFRPAEDPSAARAEAGVITGNNAPYLLLVGANAPTKRHDLAIAAFAAEVPRPWRLVLLQRRRTGGKLIRLARALHIAERLVWLETVTPTQVVVLMQGAGALIQPSTYEGFGLPVLEAMACGCPVVASDIPPVREITAGTVLLVPADDVKSLGIALREVAGSATLRRSLGEQALARAQDFSWDRCARETIAVYHDAAAAAH